MGHIGKAGSFLSWLFSLIILVSAGAPASADSAQTETAALPSGSQLGPLGLPSVLASDQAALYREIFALQDEGDFDAADERIALLSNRLLIGHVQAQRYLHPTDYISKYPELRDWLADYADHPDAGRIYRLALKRKPEDAEKPQAPVVRNIGVPAEADGGSSPYQATEQRSDETLEKVAAIKRAIRGNVVKTHFTATQAMLESAEVKALLDPVEIDWGYAQIANGWFLYGNDDKALALAQKAARHSGPDLPLAHWTAGLAAWRQGDLKLAAAHFEKVTRSHRASSWITAASAYWAGRAHRQLGHTGHTIRWFMRASEHPRTFYGLLAARALGMPMPFDFRSHRLTRGLLERLMASPETRRMLALMQVGERDRAESEMVLLGRRADPELAGALLAFAEENGIPSLSYKLASRFLGDPELSGNGGVDAGLYPLPPWQPKGGFAVDRALVYAFMRYESKFDPDAASGDGALGLMQVMPKTAAYVAEAEPAELSKEELLDPARNIDLGQRYLAHLLDHKRIGGDLLHLAAAYNGGPGNLVKWKRRMGREDDPLLFIESLPSGETRMFIERVLANLWIYRTRLGQATPSLDALAAGDWPAYMPLDDNKRTLAEDGTN